MTTTKVDYTPERWRAIGALAKKMQARYGASGNSAYKPFGNSDKQAKRFNRLLCWLLGYKFDAIEIHHPLTGCLRSVEYSATGFADCFAGVYID